MASSRPLASWRAVTGMAVASVLGQPYLWLIGAAGFALRGGIVLLLVPIVVLPTQVEVRLALGANLGSTGLTPGFWALVAVGGAIAGLVVLGLLVALARIEQAAFENTVDELSLSYSRPHRMIGRLFLVQAIALLALFAAAVPLAAAVGQAVLDELLRPSSGDSIVGRVLAHVGQPLILFGVAAALIEMVSATATRRLLSRGLEARDAITADVGGRLRMALRVLATAALGWLFSALVLVPALWGISTTFQAVRATFLATTSIADLAADPAALVVAALLSGVFCGAFLLAGLASALRSALWSAESLR